ncbi:MAG: rod shape-determining protein RodA [Bacillota bacterium]
MGVTDKRLLKHNLDWITILLVLALVGFGLISIASIMASPFEGTEKTIGDYLGKLNLEYVSRQIVNFIVGLAAMLIVLVVDYQTFKPFIKYVYAANLFLLVVLLLVGESTRGVAGWFNIGSRAFQPAELCKITLIIYLSKIVSETMDREGGLKRFADIVKVAGICAVPTLLVALQPDWGTAFVFIMVLICLLFIGRIGWHYIVGAVIFLGAALPLAYHYVMNADQRGRIDVFLDPSKDLSGKGYNVSQAKISIGSGQVYGKGFFTDGTLAQLKYVPERHTDFIFAGIVEAVGFIGGTILIALYFLLIFRWLYVAIRAKDHFGTCIVIGAMGMLLAHVFENIGMNVGIMPVTGIPLPFISYGGSNLLTNMIAVGLVLNVWMRRQVRR